MQDDFTILGPEGAPLLAELHQLCFAGAIEQAWTVEAVAALLCSPGTGSLVVMEEGQPLGFVLYRQVAGEAEIQTFCVAPEARRCGVGRRLINGFFTLMREAGVEEVFLEVREGNQPAIGLYTMCGFDTVGRRKDYYGGKGQIRYEALVMKVRV